MSWYLSSVLFTFVNACLFCGWGSRSIKEERHYYPLDLCDFTLARLWKSKESWTGSHKSRLNCRWGFQFWHSHVKIWSSHEPIFLVIIRDIQSGTNRHVLNIVSYQVDWVICIRCLIFIHQKKMWQKNCYCKRLKIWKKHL